MLLHQDNAPGHIAAVSMVVIWEIGFELLEHLRCLPDLSPGDFYLLPTLKDHPWGTKFDDNSQVVVAI